ncbi:MAG: hypothetical protein HRT90_01080 [Candidatus Margulisbacteria bacterium]|nr:hypothetical protein [Candidatus Margulisiibacteriota bacterium]
MPQVLEHHAFDGEALEALMRDIQEKQFQSPLTIFLKNSAPSKVAENLRVLMPDLKVSIDERLRSVSIVIPQNQRKSLKDFVAKLDQPSPLIGLEVQVLEINYDSMKQYDSIFSELTAGFRINYNYQDGQIVSSGPLSEFISYMVEKGEARILAKPMLLTLDNTSCSILIGDRVPYLSNRTTNESHSTFLKYIDTGISLQITPRVSGLYTILVDINTRLSNIKFWKQIGNSEVPVLSTREAITQVRVKNNDTVVIAGLINESDHTSRRGIPILMDIPVLGHLFQHSKTISIRSDIVFMITPKRIELSSRGGNPRELYSPI